MDGFCCCLWMDGWMDAIVAIVATGDLFVSVELALAVTHLFHLFLLLPFNLAIFAKLIPDPLQSNLPSFAVLGQAEKVLLGFQAVCNKALETSPKK